MNQSKIDLIKRTVKVAEDYKKSYMSFLKDNNITEKLMIFEAERLIYSNYREDYIRNRNLTFMFNEKLEELKKYKGEVKVLETEIEKFYLVSSVYNSYAEILKIQNETIGKIKASGLIDIDADFNEALIWTLNETDLIDSNEIKDFVPDITEFYLKHYFPFMKKFLNDVGMMPSGMMMSAGGFGNGNFEFIVLLNEICAWDLNDDDRVRSRINEIMKQVDYRTSGRLSQIQREMK